MPTKKSPSRETVSEAFRRLREQAGLTQEELAEKLAEVESTQNYWLLAKALGSVIRKDRLRCRYSIDELAKVTRVDVETLRIIEAGQTIDIDARDFCRIAHALGRMPDELMTMGHIKGERMGVH